MKESNEWMRCRVGQSLDKFSIECPSKSVVEGGSLLTMSVGLVEIHYFRGISSAGYQHVLRKCAPHKGLGTAGRAYLS